MRDHGADVVEARAGLRAQVQRDGQVDLALDEQVGVERERVERDRDRALDRVLDRHEPDVDLAALDGGDDVRDRAQRHRLARREVGLGLERFLGERAAGPEIADAGHADDGSGAVARHPVVWTVECVP